MTERNSRGLYIGPRKFHLTKEINYSLSRQFILFHLATVYSYRHNRCEQRPCYRTNAQGKSFNCAGSCKRSKRLRSGRDRLDLPVYFHTQGCSGCYIFLVAPCISRLSDVPSCLFVQREWETRWLVKPRAPTLPPPSFANRCCDFAFLTRLHTPVAAVALVTEIIERGWSSMSFF